MILNLGDKEPQRSSFSAAGSLVIPADPWRELSSSYVSGGTPTTLNVCSLCSLNPNHTAIQEPLRGTAPPQVGSTHLKRNHCNLQSLLEDLERGRTHAGPSTAAFHLGNQGCPSACPSACSSQPPPVAQDLSLQYLSATYTSSDYLKQSGIYIRRL